MPSLTGIEPSTYRLLGDTRNLTATAARFCKQKGIRMEPTVPYTPEMNPLSERMKRTLVEKARSMLVDACIDKRF